MKSLGLSGLLMNLPERRPIGNQHANADTSQKTAVQLLNCDGHGAAEQRLLKTRNSRVARESVL